MTCFKQDTTRSLHNFGQFFLLNGRLIELANTSSSFIQLKICIQTTATFITFNGRATICIKDEPLLRIANNSNFTDNRAACLGRYWRRRDFLAEGREGGALL
jgi:hypothetical protein